MIEVSFDYPIVSGEREMSYDTKGAHYELTRLRAPKVLEQPVCTHVIAHPVRKKGE